MTIFKGCPLSSGCKLCVFLILYWHECVCTWVLVKYTYLNCTPLFKSFFLCSCVPLLPSSRIPAFLFITSQSLCWCLNIMEVDHVTHAHLSFPWCVCKIHPCGWDSCGPLICSCIFQCVTVSQYLASFQGGAVVDKQPWHNWSRPDFG